MQNSKTECPWAEEGYKYFSRSIHNRAGYPRVNAQRFQPSSRLNNTIISCVTLERWRLHGKKYKGPNLDSRPEPTNCRTVERSTSPRGIFKAIRKMEPAWIKICGSIFRLTSRTINQPNGGTREVPCYSLTKTECLYIATKFNDEARAKLVLRDMGIQ